MFIKMREIKSINKTRKNSFSQIKFIDYRLNLINLLLK